MGNAGLAVALSVLTFNLWSLPDVGFRVLSPLRVERIAKVCEILREAAARPQGWDVVLLQEAWIASDRRQLKECGYPHSVDRDDPRRPLDSGLLILAKYPLSQSQRLTYPPLEDTASATQDGEALARKSAWMARLDHPRLGGVWVANTHLISFYEGVDRYQGIRRSQFLAFARWARRVAGNEPLILGGDWNFTRESPLWREVAAELPGFREAPEAIHHCTICPPNTMQTRNDGKIDHLFIKNGPRLTSLKGNTALTEPLETNDLRISLSDHWGWETKVEFSPP